MKYIEQAISSMSDKTVVYWGAGRRLSSFIQEYCIDNNHLPLPDYVCDSTRDVEEESIMGVPVIDFQKVREMKAADTILVITAGLMDLQAQVIKSEFYYFPMYHCRSFETYFYLQKNHEKYQGSLELLADEHSRSVYSGCLNGIMQGSLWNQALYEPEAYFSNDIIGKLKDDTQLVFAGAFNGKHIERMLRNNDKISVDACEPSRRWHAYLTNKFKQYPDITIHNNILWHQKDQLKFQDDASNEGLDAHVCSDATEYSYLVDSIDIDSLMNKKVTQIALDVEGSEQKVLNGAKNTILRDRPDLTICLYHSMDDFINIPHLINDMTDGEYKFYVKQHSCVTAIETVLYAV